KKTTYWFGYRLHLIVDANYELPVAYEVTTVSEFEFKVAHRFIDELKEKRPIVLHQCKTLIGDKGYDDTALIKRAWLCSVGYPVS
ncbi:MAG: transposase, partial [Limnochordia bacterium]|nr:transposase [Limnochordia bacterium]